MNRFFWAIGLVLLVGTMVGVGLGFNSPPPHQETAAPPAIMAVGYIDGEFGVSKLYPLQPGKAVKTLAEGTFLKKGEPILWLDEEMAEVKWKRAKADYDAALALQEQSKQLPEQRRLKLEQQTAGVNATKLEKSLADKQLKDSAGIPQQLKETYELKLQKFAELVKVEEAKLEELKLNNPNIEMTRADANATEKKLCMEEAKWALDQCQLVAPSDGTVLRVHVNPGEVLGPSPTRPAVEFLPKGALIVRAEVLQEWANRVKMDQDVEITDDTYQGPTYKGKVYFLSPWFTQKRNLIIEPFTYNDVRFLECLVRVTSPEGDVPLRVGQRVRVKIKS
jgi:HlyD family secretion protein